MSLVCYEAGSHVVKDDLELVILLPPPPSVGHHTWRCGSGDQTQGFVYVRQSLWQLAIAPVHGIFNICPYTLYVPIFSHGCLSFYLVNYNFCCVFFSFLKIAYCAKFCQSSVLWALLILGSTQKEFIGRIWGGSLWNKGKIWVLWLWKGWEAAAVEASVQWTPPSSIMSLSSSLKTIRVSLVFDHPDPTSVAREREEPWWTVLGRLCITKEKVSIREIQFLLTEGEI